VVAEVESPPIPESVQYYEIKKGDTLWAIANEHYGSGAKYKMIVEANKEVIKDADKIFPGQKIRIPAE
jgi:nucleoid-associated protein YgaU